MGDPLFIDNNINLLKCLTCGILYQPVDEQKRKFGLRKAKLMKLKRLINNGL